MAELPLCVNFIKRRGCSVSRVRLAGEGDDHWTFECDTCKLIFVTTKPLSNARSHFRNAEEKLRQAAIKRREREKSPVYFT